MASKKTIKVQDLIDIVNRRNKHSTCSPEVRKGWNSLLEEVLHKTDNYNGFNFLAPDEVPEGEKPGIECFNQDTSKNVFPDESRKVFYSVKKAPVKQDDPNWHNAYPMGIKL